MSIRLLETAKPTMILDLTTTTTTKKTRLVASGVINVKKSHLKGVHYHVMHPSYPRPSVKSFIITVKRKWNSACQYRENYATIVFQPTVNALIFLWMVFLCRIFFLTHMHLQDIFFSKSPSPNPLFQTSKYMHHLKKPVLSAGYDRELTFSFQRVTQLNF